MKQNGSAPFQSEKSRGKAIRPAVFSSFLRSSDLQAAFFYCLTKCRHSNISIEIEASNLSFSEGGLPLPENAMHFSFQAVVCGFCLCHSPSFFFLPGEKEWVFFGFPCVSLNAKKEALSRLPNRNRALIRLPGSAGKKHSAAHRSNNDGKRKSPAGQANLSERRSVSGCPVHPVH